MDEMGGDAEAMGIYDMDPGEVREALRLARRVGTESEIQSASSGESEITQASLPRSCSQVRPGQVGLGLSQGTVGAPARFRP